MADHATPNLPSRNFAATSAFYAALGFVEEWRDDGWMILKRGGATLEFFPHPELDPLASWFSCCVRLDDLDAFYALAKAAGLPNLQRPAAPAGPDGRTFGAADRISGRSRRDIAAADPELARSCAVDLSSARNA